MSSIESTPLISIHQLALYNTGRMTPEQVIVAFAVRRQQFDRVIADLAAEKPRSRAQHHLIVGQRGMGKTMFLARVAAELRTNTELSARFVPLVFVEEQYAVDRLSKFWLNCLDSLADARELSGGDESVEEIDRTVARLTVAGMRAARDDQPFADEVYAEFSKLAGAAGQRPVLLVDNLQLVFERLDEGQQHSLRELLMRPGSPILIGASPSPPPETQDYRAAFYDQFKVHYLRPLDESEMRSLLLHLADAAQRDDVRQRVLQHPARLTVLRQLTGGNPRTVLTLFFLYAEDFAPSVFGDLESLLDRVTPLYKARFEELTPQQQVVASAIANHWDPVTAAKLAAMTGLPPGTISAQLDRLEKTGVVERTELFGETRTGYQLAERFFNIWFLMRSASRRQRREVEFLTRFLESFYEPADRSRLARQLMDEDRFSPDRFVWSRAVADSLTEPETAEELRRHTELASLREEAREARARLRELIDFDKLPPATLAFDELRRKLMALVPEDAGIATEEFAKAVLGDRRMFVSGERERLAARSGELSAAEIEGVLKAIQTARATDEVAYSKDAVDWFSQRLERGQLRALRDVEDWNRAFRQASGERTFRLMVDSLPYQFDMQISESNLNKITAALQPDAADNANAWFSWGNDLDARLGRYSEAEVAYRKAIAHDPEHIGAWDNLGFVLHASRRYDEAEAAYKMVITLDPSEPNPWNGLGILYCDHLDRPTDAAEAYDRALSLDPSYEATHHNRLFLRRDFLGEGSAARPLLDAVRTLAFDPWPDTTNLHEALFAAYEMNWGLATQALAGALDVRIEGFSQESTIDWLRASAVLLHLNFGAELLAFLDQHGDTARLRPWVEALRALQIGDRRALQNIAPEIRTTAEVFYDGIESLLKKLPEKTRRRPFPKEKKTRKRRR